VILVKGMFVSAFCHFFISFREIQKLDGPKSEMLGENCFQLLAYEAIQFLDLPKANKNDKKLETNMP
jgi:hypothetical protein